MTITSGLFAQNDLETTLCSKDGWALIIKDKQTLNPKTNSYYYKVTSNYFESLALKNPKTDIKTFVFNPDGTFTWSANASCGNTYPHGGTGKWRLEGSSKKTIALLFESSPEGWNEKTLTYTVKSVTPEKIDFKVETQMR